MNTLPIKFSVLDYQGLPTLSSFALTQTPFSFYPTLTSSATQISTKKVLWDFGDGTTSSSITAQHAYTWPGIYNVTLLIYDINANSYISSYSPSVSVIDFINNQLVADTVNTISFNVPAGQVLPFVINRTNSWQTYSTLSASGYTINLYVSGSIDPLADLEAYNKSAWSHLLQQAYFYNKQIAGSTVEYVPVSSIATSTTLLYGKFDINNNIVLALSSDSSSFFVGTSGYATPYFTSNKPKNYNNQSAPLIIFCSLDTTSLQDPFTSRVQYFNYNSQSIGYLNTKPAVLYAYSTYNPATNISFSTNGLDTQGDAVLSTFRIPQISWQNTAIPFVAKLKDNKNFTTLFYPLLSSNVQNLTSNSTYYNASFKLVDNNYKPLSALFYSEFLPYLPSDVGGYFKGYVVIPNAASTAYLSATVAVQDPGFYQLNTINTVYSNTTGSNLFATKDIISSSGNTSSRNITFNSYASNNVNANSYATSPSAYATNKNILIWALSSSNNSILTMNYDGSIANQYSILSILNNSVSSAQPYSLALDGFNNGWISLYAASSAIKINSSGSLLNRAYKNNLPINNLFPVNQLTYTLLTIPLVTPKFLDTDQYNNVWVAYYNPSYNYVIKYSSTGVYLNSIIVSNFTVPDKILIDRFSNAWVIGKSLYRTTSGTSDSIVTLSADSIVTLSAESMVSLSQITLSGSSQTLIDNSNLTQGSDYLYKTSNNCQLLSSLSGFYYPTGIAEDVNGNVWISHNVNTLTRVNKDNGTFTNYTLGSTYLNDGRTQVLYNLTCDTYNNLFVYNFVDDKIFVLNASSPSASASYVLGLGTINQTFEDINGYRWITKYGYNPAVNRIISGISNAFAIYPSTGVYNITKQNEDFDASSFFNTLKLPEYLIDKNVLFSQFLGSIFGTASSAPYEIGKTLYERIGNFSDNTSNIDTATVDGVISMSQQTGTNIANAVYDFPPQLRRVVDLLSIKRSKLFGTPNQYSYTFTALGNQQPSNLGKFLNTSSDTFSASETLVVKEKFSNIYRTIKMPLLSGYPATRVLSLSNYTSAWNLPLILPPSLIGSDVGLYYDFYRFNYTPLGNIVDSVINWNDDTVTLQYTNSSYSAWTSQDGIMDNIINYEMSKGLRLFTSATYIVYNN
jgi:hypothetical protein